MFKFCVWRRFRWKPERSHCIMSRKLLMAGSLQVRIHQIIVTTPVGEPGQFPCLRINLSAVAKIRFPMTGFTLGDLFYFERLAGNKRSPWSCLPSSRACAAD